MKKLLCSLILPAFVCVSTHAQNKQIIDSLSRKLVIAKQDTSRSLLLSDLSFEYRNSHPDTALLMALEGLDLAKDLDFPRGQSLAMVSASAVYYIQGDIAAAMDFAYQALEMAEINHYPYETARALNMLGNLSTTTGDTARALNYYRQALVSNKNTTDKQVAEFWEVLFEGNLGFLYKQTNQLDSALKYLEKAINRSKLDNSRDYYILNQLGAVHFQMGERDSGLALSNKAKLFCEKDEDSRGAAIVYLTLAGYFNEMKKKDSAIYYAGRSLALAESIGNKSGVLHSSMLLSELYAPDNSSEAYKYLKIAVEANEEINGTQKIQALQKTISDEQERKRKIEAERIKTWNNQKQWALLIGLFVFIAIAIFLFRNNAQKNRANKKLETALIDLKSAQAQLIQAGKMASLGELTSGIAHEIQNPLNFVNNFSEVNHDLLVEMNEEIRKGNLDEVRSIALDIMANQEKISLHGKRADAIVKGMQQHSRSGKGEKIMTDLNALADEYLRLALHGMKRKDEHFHARLKTDYDRALASVNIVPQDIGRVLLNLYNNAFYATNEQKKIKGENFERVVEVRTTATDAGFEIHVTDNGIGIPSAIKDKIFQPFFTTKPTGEGTGLGLSLAYDIVQSHGGDIRVNSVEGQGSEFIVVFNV